MNLLFRFLNDDNTAFQEVFTTDARLQIEVTRDTNSSPVSQKAIYDCDKTFDERSSDYVENCELVFVPIYKQFLKLSIKSTCKDDFAFETTIPFMSKNFKISSKYRYDYRKLVDFTSDTEDENYMSLFDMITGVMKVSRIAINYWPESVDKDGNKIEEKIHIMVDADHIFIS